MFSLLDERGTPATERPTNEIVGPCYLYRSIPDPTSYIISEPIALAADVAPNLTYVANYMRIMRKEITPTGLEVLMPCPNQPIGSPTTYIVTMNDLYLAINDTHDRFILTNTLGRSVFVNIERYQHSDELFPRIRIRWNTYVLTADLTVVQANKSDSDRSDYHFVLVDEVILRKNYIEGTPTFITAAPFKKNRTDLLRYVETTPFLAHNGATLMMIADRDKPALVLSGL